MDIIKGKVWKFGDNVNTDLICPGPMMRLPIDELARGAMAGLDPNFYKKISKDATLLSTP